jgi:hypothetical protein
MIQNFVDAFIEKQKTLFVDEHPGSYEGIVEDVIRAINPDGDYDGPDPSRIHTIDDGDYQGTLVFVIGAGGYQPHRYWATSVSYGSCGGCDTLQGIRDEGNSEDGSPTDRQAEDYQMLALHLVQGLAEI